MLSKEAKDHILRRIFNIEETLARKSLTTKYEKQRIETLRALRVILKRGYLSLECARCGNSFFCSGICLYKKGSLSLVTKSEIGKCLCAKCDKSDKKWIDRCKKEKNSFFYLFAHYAELMRKKKSVEFKGQKSYPKTN